MLFDASGFPGGTRCGISFHWLGTNVASAGIYTLLEKAHLFATITCMTCIAAPPDPDYNPWA